MNGYRKYSQFLAAPPLVTVEWHDSETEARGWLVINSLTGGAAGGGTRMRAGATRNEALFLAKTMEIKFGISGPPIGGGKSVIDFDARDPRRHGVLSRWFEAIGPYLSHCYGTGGDLGVDEVKEVIPLTSQLMGLRHPQEGIVRGHLRVNEREFYRILAQLKTGVELPVTLGDVPGAGRFRVADLVTGYGVFAAARRHAELTGRTLVGQRVLVEGFGAVGGSAAYYLAKAGARIVGIVSRTATKDHEYRWAIDPEGLPIAKLLGDRVGAHLPDCCEAGQEPTPFWQAEADMFVPAAASHTLTPEILDRLHDNGVRTIACAANNPFSDLEPGATDVQRQADGRFTVIADFIANCGMARVFALLMESGARCDEIGIFAGVDAAIDDAMTRLLDGHRGDTDLLGRAYEVFVPDTQPPV